MKHKIFLEYIPGRWDTRCLREGFYGPTEQVININHFIYCRTTEDKAWEYDSEEAFNIVGEMLRKGYPARCIPPVTITR